MRRREQLESVPSPRHHGPQGRAETLEFVQRSQVQVVVRVLPADSSAERSHADLQPSPAALAVALGLWNDRDSCTRCALVASVPSLTGACAHTPAKTCDLQGKKYATAVRQRSWTDKLLHVNLHGLEGGWVETEWVENPPWDLKPVSVGVLFDPPGGATQIARNSWRQLPPSPMKKDVSLLEVQQPQPSPASPLEVQQPQPSPASPVEVEQPQPRASQYPVTVSVCTNNTTRAPPASHVSKDKPPTRPPPAAPGASSHSPAPLQKGLPRAAKSGNENLRPPTSPLPPTPKATTQTWLQRR